LRQLEQIRQTGISLDRDEWDPGWTGTAVPVRFDDTIVAMISVMATTQRFDAELYEKISERLRNAAAAAEAAL